MWWTANCFPLPTSGKGKFHQLVPMHPMQVEARLKQEAQAEKARQERELAAHKKEQDERMRQVRLHGARLCIASFPVLLLSSANLLATADALIVRDVVCRWRGKPPRKRYDEIVGNPTPCWLDGVTTSQSLDICRLARGCAFWRSHDTLSTSQQTVSTAPVQQPASQPMGGNPFGGNPFGGNHFGGNPYGGMHMGGPMGGMPMGSMPGEQPPPLKLLCTCSAFVHVQVQVTEQLVTCVRVVGCLRRWRDVRGISLTRTETDLRRI